MHLYRMLLRTYYLDNSSVFRLWDSVWTMLKIFWGFSPQDWTACTYYNQNESGVGTVFHLELVVSMLCFSGYFILLLIELEIINEFVGSLLMLWVIGYNCVWHRNKVSFMSGKWKSWHSCWHFSPWKDEFVMSNCKVI